MQIVVNEYKFQFLKGSIKSPFDRDTGMNPEFQFLKGSIKSYSGYNNVAFKCSFNSSKVR